MSPRARRRIVTAASLTLAAPIALALGFGRNNNSSTLGQPLNFSVPLRFEQGEFVSVECVQVELQTGDTNLAPNLLRVTLDEARDGVADRILRVSTGAPIDEPVATVEVAIGCPPHVRRSFTVLLDPPTVNLAQSPASAPEAASVPEADRGATPALPIPPSRHWKLEVPGLGASEPRRARTARPVIQPAEERELTQPKESPANTTARSAVPVARNSSGPRLRLDPLERPPVTPPRAASAVPLPAGVVPEAMPGATAGSTAVASATATGTPSTASTASTAASSAAQSASAAAGNASGAGAATAAAGLDLSRPPTETPPEPSASMPTGADARLQGLEQRLAEVNAEAAKTRDALVSLQSRLREAEADRYANPVVYALVALVALLLAALIALVVWLRRRDARRAVWWQSTMADPDRAESLAWPVLAEQGIEPSALPATPEVSSPVPSAAPGAEPSVVAAPVAPAAVAARTAERGPEISAAPVIDTPVARLDAALHSAARPQPVEVARLLALHHAEGNVDAYAAALAAHAARHGALAPAWDADAGAAGRGLEADAPLRALVQNVWATPARAMAVLERLLTRRTEHDRSPDLATLLDLVFLHAVAEERLRADGPTV